MHSAVPVRAAVAAPVVVMLLAALVAPARADPIDLQSPTATGSTLIMSQGHARQTFFQATEDLSVSALTATLSPILSGQYFWEVFAATPTPTAGSATPALGALLYQSGPIVYGFGGVSARTTAVDFELDAGQHYVLSFRAATGAAGTHLRFVNESTSGLPYVDPNRWVRVLNGGVNGNFGVGQLPVFRMEAEPIVQLPPPPPNDGAAVPLPAAAWAGFALLGGVGAARRLRRRWANGG